MTPVEFCWWLKGYLDADKPSNVILSDVLNDVLHNLKGVVPAPIEKQRDTLKEYQDQLVKWREAQQTKLNPWAPTSKYDSDYIL
jgi:hypothetical protein